MKRLYLLALFTFILLISSESLFAQLTGTKTIDPAGSGGDNYTTFTAAVNALNSSGVGAGGVTFNVKDGSTFAETVPAITATGTASNQIIFQRDNSTGTRPVVKPTGGAGTTDAGITISGSDYITFNGIDITINTGNAVEYGYYVKNASATDGAQYVTIKNTTVTLNRTNYSSIGIYQSVATAPTAATGANSYNVYDNVYINNVYRGMLCTGNASYPDLNTEIKNSLIGGTSAGDIGSPTSISSGTDLWTAGLRADYQSGFTIHDNEIRNVTYYRTTSNTSYGVYLNNIIGTSSFYNNKVHDVVDMYSSSGSSNLIEGIEALGASGCTLNFYNNMVYKVYYGGASGGTNRQTKGVYFSGTGTYNVSYNSIYLSDATSSAASVLEMTGVTANVKNNILKYGNMSSSRNLYCFYVAGGTLNTSDYNNFDSYGTSGSYYTGYFSSARSTLAAWQTATGKDANSKQFATNFTSATNLHLNLSSVDTNYAATVISGITIDIDNETRNVSKPYKGADENLTYPLAASNPPTIQVTNITFGSVAQNTMSVSWTNGDGNGRAIFMKEGSQGTITDPSTGTVYTPSTDWNSKGTQLGSSGYYCIYNGSGATVSLTNLVAGTTYWVQAYDYNGGGSNCLFITTTATNNPNSQATSAAVVPTVTTAAITSITASTASSGGTVTATGGVTVTARGVCWSTSANPTIADNTTIDGSGLGSFTSSMTLLVPNTTYHVRAYATNSVGTGYGNDSVFTTLEAGLPTLTTTAVSNITANTATSGGDITADGGSAVTARGVCWNTTGTPIVTDSHTSDGSGTGSYVSSLTGLAMGTVYYVRAYATNGNGTAYGNQQTFNTPAVYYNVASSDVSQLSNWGSNTNGTGSHPASFSIDNAVYNMYNAGSTIASNLTVTGTGSKLVLGDGTNAVTFTIPNTASVSGTMDVSNNATLTIRNNTLPTFGTISTGSTFAFDGADSLVIAALNYGNLQSTNDAAAKRTLASSGTIGIAGTFTKGSATYTTTGSTVSFNGTSAQDIPAFTFNNLTTANTAGCTTNGDITVNGTINISEALIIGSSNNLTLGTASTFNLAASKTLTVNGTLTNTKDGSSIYTIGSGAVITFSSTGQFVSNVASTTGSAQIPTATWQSGSTCKVTGLVGTSGSDFNNLYGVSQTFSNFTIDIPNFLGKLVLNYRGGSFAVNGTMTVVNPGTYTAGMQITRSGTQESVTIGNYVQNAGAVYIVHNTGNTTTKNVTITGNFTLTDTAKFGLINASSSLTTNLNVGGTFSMASGTKLLKDNSTGTGNLVFNGSAGDQNATFGTVTGAANITVNKTSGNVVAGSNIPVNGNLTLTSGKIVLGTHDITFASSSTVSGGSSTSFIIAASSGQVKKTFTSAGSFTFPLGETDGTTEYSPVTVRFNSGTFNSGEVTAKVVNAKHPNNTSTTDYLNRYWQLTSTGITAFNADVKANYLQADVAGTEANIYCGKWNGSSWTGYSQVAPAEDSLKAYGVTSFSDFTGGEASVMGSKIQVNLTAVVQGYYDSTANRLMMKDTFMVYLANTSAPWAFVDTARIVIDSLTFTGSATFNNANSGSYYLVLGGRNLVETWTGTTLTLSQGTPYSYNFTTAVTQAFGNNMAYINSKYCIFNGDVNQDQFIDFSDLTLIDNDAYNYTSGYVLTDVNGDMYVDFTDLTIVDNNSYNYIGVAKPSVKSGFARPVHRQHFIEK